MVVFRRYNQVAVGISYQVFERLGFGRQHCHTKCRIRQHSRRSFGQGAIHSKSFDFNEIAKEVHTSLQRLAHVLRDPIAQSSVAAPGWNHVSGTAHENEIFKVVVPKGLAMVLAFNGAIYVVLRTVVIRITVPKFSLIRIAGLPIYKWTNNTRDQIK